MYRPIKLSIHPISSVWVVGGARLPLSQPPRPAYLEKHQSVPRAAESVQGTLVLLRGLFPVVHAPNMMPQRRPCQIAEPTQLAPYNMKQ